MAKKTMENYAELETFTSEHWHNIPGLIYDFAGLTDSEFNYCIPFIFGAVEVNGAAAFKKVTTTGETVLILKAGLSNLGIYDGYHRFQKGYNLSIKGYFSQRKFENELKKADYVLIPMCTLYFHHAKPFKKPSNLKNNVDHSLLIIYSKKTEKYLIVDSMLFTKPNQPPYPLPHKIQTQIIPFYRDEFGLIGTSTTHKFQKAVPFSRTCWMDKSAFSIEGGRLVFPEFQAEDEDDGKPPAGDDHDDVICTRLSSISISEKHGRPSKELNEIRKSPRFVGSFPFLHDPIPLDAIEANDVATLSNMELRVKKPVVDLPSRKVMEKVVRKYNTRSTSKKAELTQVTTSAPVNETKPKDEKMLMKRRTRRQ
ncbi:unnamed protein product [Orchesella dallaii]|uniref:Uncharacterized protein n=1 Tax=Orchesella dallaii TaxID=48710 RepID=A0ABP1RYP6_9HEXA